MGVVTGCGCKEVHRFPHSTYPYSSCIYSFLKQHPYFFFSFFFFSFLFQYFFVQCILGYPNPIGQVAKKSLDK